MPQAPSSKERGINMDRKHVSGSSGNRSWFLGIGINQYTNFPSLVNAVKDIQDLMQLLQTDYGFEEGFMLTLFDEQATRKNIISALDRLEKEVAADDSLLVYYSGHGHLNEETGKGYWIPTNAERDNTVEYIRNSTIREYIETIHSLHTLLISDACFSGSLFSRGGMRSSRAMDELAKIPSRWAICSGRHDEEVYDGEPGKNSPFAESIMDTLRFNQEEQLNVGKLVDRVIEQTSANYRQLPEGNPLFNVGHKGGQYIFRRIQQTPKTAAKEKVPVKTKKPSSKLEETQVQETLPSLPGKKELEASVNLSPANIQKIKAALEDLLTRTDEDLFLTIETKPVGNYFQFAATDDDEFWLNLPGMQMDEAELVRAIDLLEAYGISAGKRDKIIRDKRKLGDEAYILFEGDVASVDTALEIASRVLLEVFGCEPEVQLVVER